MNPQDLTPEELEKLKNEEMLSPLGSGVSPEELTRLSQADERSSSLFDMISKQARAAQLKGDVGAPPSPQAAPPTPPPVAQAAPLEPSPLPAAPAMAIEEPKDDEMKRAQSYQEAMSRLALLGKAGSTIGEGIARVGTPGMGTVDKSIWDDVHKMGDVPVKQIKERREAMDKALASESSKLDLDNKKRLADPNSAESLLYRQILRQASPKAQIPDSLTATQAEKILPHIKKIAEEGMTEYQRMRMLHSEQRIEQRSQWLGLSGQRLGQSMRRLDWQMEEKFEDDVQKARKDAMSEPGYKAAQTVLSAIPKLESLIQDASTEGGPSMSVVGPLVAKGIAGDVGALTEKDVVMYVQQPALVPKVLDTISKLKDGKFTQHTAQDLGRVLLIMRAKAEETKNKVLLEHAILFSRREKENGRHLSIEEAKHLLIASEGSLSDEEKLAYAKLLSETEQRVIKGVVYQKVPGTNKWRALKNPGIK